MVLQQMLEDFYSVSIRYGTLSIRGLKNDITKVNHCGLFVYKKKKYNCLKNYVASSYETYTKPSLGFLMTSSNVYRK